MKLQTKILLIMVIAFLLTFSILEWLDYNNIKNAVVNQMRYEARHIRGVLMATRRVYHQQFLASGIPLTDKTLGFLPAHSLSLISKDFDNWTDDKLYFNNVSDRPRNQRNTADSIEEKAISCFRENPTEKERFISFKSSAGDTFYHYSAPIWLEEYCLKCHGKKEDAPVTIRNSYDSSYGYETGDLRGVMSIKLPATQLNKLVHANFLQNFWVHLSSFTCIFFLIVFLLNRYVTVPLSRITKGLSSVGEGSSHPLIEGLSGEMALVGNTFNQMSKRLSERDSMLKESEGKLRAIINNTTAVIYMKDPQGKYLLINNQYEKLFHISKKKIIGKTDFEIFPEDIAHAFCENDRKVMESERAVQFEELVPHDDGLHTYVSLKFPLLNTEKVVSGICGISTDITERKKSEIIIAEDSAKLTKANKELTLQSEIIKNMAEGVYIVSMVDSRIIYANPKFEKMFGYSEGEINSKHASIVNVQTEIDPKITARVIMTELSKTGEWHGEVNNVKKDGTDFWCYANISVFSHVEYGKVFVSVHTDITDLKDTETALQNSEERYRFLAEATSSVIWTTDESGGFVTPQTSWEKYTGQPWNEHKDYGWTKKIHSDDIDRILKGWRKAILEMSLCTSWGRIWSAILKEWRDFEVRAVPILRPNGSLREWVGIITDITTRKQIERELKQLNETLEDRVNERTAEIAKLSHAVEHSSTTIIITDIKGTIEYVNPWFTKTTGYSAEEAIGQNPRILKSGEQKPEYYCELWKTITSGKEWKGEFHNKKKDGELYWEFASISPIKNNNNIITNFVAIKEDITTRKNVEAELKEASEKAQRATEAKSAFLSSMSHELRTPMNSIIGFAQLLLSNHKEPLVDSQKERVNHILNASNHLFELISEVLDLSSIESGKLLIEYETVEVSSVINEAIISIEPMAHDNKIRIDNQSKYCDHYIRADRKRLTQVLANLLTNAIKYNKHDGSVSISCESPDVDTVRISVEDTGLGIAKHDLKSLFEPFNRLGRETLNIDGTGVGLTITKTLVGNMGGSIGVESEEGKGSTFFVDLQKAKTSVTGVTKSKDLADGQHVTASKNKILLYIDDDVASLTLVEHILKRRPSIKLLNALQAQSGIALAQTEHPDLILIDINLPELDGYEALKLLISNDTTKRIPTIAISADAMPDAVKKGIAAGFIDYITKPLNVNNFLKVIDNILNEGEK